MSPYQNDQPQDSWEDRNDFLPDEVPEGGAHDSGRIRTGKRRLRLLPRLLLALVICGGLLLLMNETLLKIRSVQILGNRAIEKAAIAHLTGLDKETTYLTVNAAEVRRRLETNPYLEFVSLKKIFPSTLVLEVRERAPCANVQGAGARYLVDDYAYVLDRISKTDERNTLPLIYGMNISEAVPGRKLISTEEGRVDTYCALIQELMLQGVVNAFAEINLTNPDHIYLQHNVGFTADIGTAKELMMKIGMLRAVIDELIKSGVYNGFIDASIPGTAIFTPEG